MTSLLSLATGSLWLASECNQSAELELHGVCHQPWNPGFRPKATAEKPCAGVVHQALPASPLGTAPIANPHC